MPAGIARIVVGKSRTPLSAADVASVRTCASAAVKSLNGPVVWVKTLQRLGLPLVGMHALRHSAAARVISAGWQAKAVQQTLGHRSAAFTLTVYGHLIDDDLDALGDALDGASTLAGGGHVADTH